ncbi:MAG: protein translocase subunit SecD [Dehalococcoidales bacterium]|nr:protein translocase subunit SecD [Dehalococcoidales bacterium]
MLKSNNIILLIIAAIFTFTLWVLFPVDSNRLGREGLRLGLDLVGGVHLVYQADFSQNTTTEQQAAIDRTILTIENRIDRFGVTEPVIQQLGADRIMIQLPGFTDINAAKRQVEETGYLEFREVERKPDGSLVTLNDYLTANMTDFYQPQETISRVFVNMDFQSEDYGKFVTTLIKGEDGLIFTDIEGNVIDEETLTLYSGVASWVPSRGDDGTPLTGALLDDAQPAINRNTNQPEIDIQWNSEGTVIFDQIAVRLYNPTEIYSLEHVLGIFLDSNLLSAPQIKEQNFDGRGVISGSFTLDEATQLANLLKSGSLPMPLVKPPEYEEKVSATLGAEFIDMSWKAGLVGLALVMLFMIAYYRLPGFLASLALIFYATLTLTVCKLWPITLSLGSIGGIIVSIGIAVDANVLIFERMKEEFRAGRTLGAAVEAGFHRAWSAIWDSNMTTFIACIILYWLGSTAVHNAAVIGFAVTLFIGALVSIFTAVLVTRTLLRALVGTGLSNKTWLFTVSGGKK